MAIGASAGGLEAFKAFLSAMPPTSGLAFVLIPHLDPRHESLMVELLAKHTAMPVAEATDGTRIAPDHVYVIPPNRYLAVHNGTLQLSEPPSPRGVPTAIDFCFRSLAGDQRERAIGIVLSGTGSHGTLGVKEIKLFGGMVMVQDPASAEYDQMPRSAIDTGLVDFVLPPDRMPAALLRYVTGPYLNHATAGAETADEGQRELNRVLALLRARTKYDFRGYRPRMLLRRLQRRMGLRHLDSYTEYVERLRDDPKELAALSKDFLIGVTSFFRDPQAFEVFAQRVVPELVVRASADRPLRIWVPGCATGEEAYSIIILLHEAFGAARRPASVQIFATDVDEQALATARAGVYGDSITGDVSPGRLQRFFTKIDDHHYQVNKLLRDGIVFAPQNLISDAPFSKLDLISCRNLLIYLETSVQEKVVSLFHFALNADGYLLLGPSESIGGATDLFESVSRKWRIFRRIGETRRELVEIPVMARHEHAPRAVLPRRRPAPTQALRYGDLVQGVLRQVGPAVVVVNARLEVLYHQGPAVQYLEFPVGEPTRDLMALVRDGLRTKLRAACLRAARDDAAITGVDARVRRDGQYVPCTVAVHPVALSGEPERLLVVTMQDQERPLPGDGAAEAAGEESALVRQLEAELRTTREDLQTTIEEMESSNEELKASNEEVMSMNEELQSTNEELETSKEELQSLNEELSTVNNQLEEKVLELDRSHSDITSLLNSTEIATVFLDTRLRVRRFTPAIGKLLSLVPGDVGRPITDFAAKFHDPSLVADCRHVLEHLTKIDKEVWSVPEHAERTDTRGPGASDKVPPNAQWYLRRIFPYRTSDNRIEGVVVTFIDITERLQGEDDRLEMIRLREMVDHLPAGAVYVGKDGIALNRAAEAVTGYARDELRTLDDWFEVLYGERNAEIRKAYEADWGDGFPVSRVVALRRKDGEDRLVEFTAHRFDEHAVWLIRDVTDTTRAEETLRDREEALRAIVDTAVDAIVTIDTQGRIQAFNPAAERMFGYSAAEVKGQGVQLLMPEPYRSQHDRYLARYLETHEARIIGIGRELVGRRKDGTTFPMHLAVSEMDHLGRFTGLIRDLSSQKRLERRVTVAQVEERRRLARDVHDGIGGHLVGLAVLADTLKTQLEQDGSRLAGRAAELASNLHDARALTGRIARGLMPVENVPEGLVVALEQLASRCTRDHGVRCRFDGDPALPVEDVAAANELYRVAEEAVTNAVRHGKPREIMIDVRVSDDRLRLTVADDGLGFEPRAGRNGIGLVSMRQRAVRLGGTLTVDKRPDGGTIAALDIPWPQPPAHALDAPSSR